jgi:hypothetical protein
MKISVKVKDIKIEMDDESTESIYKYTYGADIVNKIIKEMSNEAKELLKIDNHKSL